MMNIGNLEINGIKCDNPVCNYAEEDVAKNGANRTPMTLLSGHS